MKQNGILYKVRDDGVSGPGSDQLFSHPHPDIPCDTPLRNDAFDLPDDEKIKAIAVHFRKIMNTSGLDLDNDSLKNTPDRVAKMFVREIFSGLHPDNKPSVTLFDNKYRDGQIVVEKNITVYSTCEHHFVPVIGKAHIGYISGGKIIGLSKINRIVQYYSRRPQVQERLTVQIASELSSVLGTEDVAVIIDAVHLCVSSRGIRDVNSGTVTAEFRGAFQSPGKKEELFNYLR